MRLLLDEQIPHVFADLLRGHDVSTVDASGWKGLKNGELLRVGAEAGFVALVTIDKNLEFQQNLAALPMSVVLMVGARSNRFEDLERFAPGVLEAVEGLGAPALVKVGV